MHRGILLSFYSSAAGFVNGKCACFLPGFLGRAQKSPGRGRTIWNARRVRFAHIQRKNYFYFAFVALCGALQTHFHGGGRNGKRHLPQARQKKAPEGDCSPGKKGLMILYLFVVVGVLEGFLTLNAIAM